MEEPRNWWVTLRNASTALGLSAICTSFLAGNDLLSLQLAKPVILTSIFLLFPLFIIFALKSLFDENEEENKKVPFLKFIFSLVPFYETLRMTPKFFLVVSLVLFFGGIWLLVPFDRISWSLTDPFQKEHAIGFGAASSIFYAVLVANFSIFATRINEQKISS